MKKVIMSSYYSGGNIFSDNPDLERGGNINEVREQLLAKGYEIKAQGTCDPHEAHAIFFLEGIPYEGGPNYEFFKQCVEQGLVNKMRLFLIEAPIVTPHSWNLEFHKYFVKIYTWNDDLIDNKKYFKINYFQSLLNIQENISFNQRKLCTLISGNKMHYSPLELYSERIEAIRAFERLGPYEFDLYGTCWNQPRSQVQQLYPFLVPKFPSYRGPVEKKLPVLSRYKFSICYENMIGLDGYRGYITEKIFNSLMARCVPVYLGAVNITDYVPDNVFIDRRKFNSYDELYTYLINISEKQFDEYLHNIDVYLSGYTFYKHFSQDSFIKMFLKDLAE
jgi:alpha(1,3/1,4) fucosyltransferase